MLRFRWAKLQLDRLGKLRLANKQNVIKTLHDLPKDLNETYERTLVELSDEADEQISLIEHAKAAVRILIFARHPLYIEEFLDAMAISVSLEHDWESFRV